MGEIKNYFAAERAESFLFAVVGILAVLLAVYFFTTGTAFLRGMAVPLLLIGLIQSTVGSLIVVRSPKDTIRVQAMLGAGSSAGLRTEELPRMEKVMRSFVLYRWIEIAFILIGIALMFLPGRSEWWRGFGFGLFAQAALMLGADFFAERRGDHYLRFLQQTMAANATV